MKREDSNTDLQKLLKILEKLSAADIHKVYMMARTLEMIAQEA